MIWALTRRKSRYSVTKLRQFQLFGALHQNFTIIKSNSSLCLISGDKYILHMYCRIYRVASDGYIWSKKVCWALQEELTFKKIIVHEGDKLSSSLGTFATPVSKVLWLVHKYCGSFG